MKTGYTQTNQYRYEGGKLLRKYRKDEAPFTVEFLPVEVGQGVIPEATIDYHMRKFASGVQPDELTGLLMVSHENLRSKLKELENASK